MSKISKPLTATERGRSLTDGWQSADTRLVGQGETCEYTQTTEIRDLQSTSSFPGLSQITTFKDVQSTHLKGHNKGRHEQRDRNPNMSDWLKRIEENKTHPPAPLQALTFWTSSIAFGRKCDREPHTHRAADEGGRSSVAWIWQLSLWFL